MKDFFYQDGPTLGNQYLDDRLLRSTLERVLPAEMRAEISDDLERLGGRVVGDIAEMCADAERNEPELVNYEPWGRRVDEVVMARGWKHLERVGAEEGLVAIAYERKYGALSRLYQFAKLYLFHPSSATVTCPLAMTDGAARLLELYGSDELRDQVSRRLLSRDPDRFWTSGQWMTERTGGSDVGRTETVAKKDGEHYRLYGPKYFTSAVTANVAMTLARVEDADGKTRAGSRGLSLFFLEIHDEQGRPNQLKILRLKDKLGTRALPTAELDLEGTPARLIGKPGAGVRNIATLLNITRLYNALTGAAIINRGLALARDYARRREAFGKPLAQLPLHLETLAHVAVERDAAFLFVFHAVGLLGRVECGEASEAEQAELRLMTPLVKLFVAKQSIAAISELLECFGGAGYVEDTGLPRLLRDAQVGSIWEGTTNVLALDGLRAINKEAAFAPMVAAIKARLEALGSPALRAASERAREALGAVERFLPEAADLGLDALQAGARDFAYALSKTVIASLMLEHADWLARGSACEADKARAAHSAQRFCEGLIVRLDPPDPARREASALLADC